MSISDILRQLSENGVILFPYAILLLTAFMAFTVRNLPPLNCYFFQLVAMG
jgi:hypothetical protein